MKRTLTSLLLSAALVAMPFSLTVADCGMDHGAKAENASAQKKEMASGKKENMPHPKMMQHMNDQHKTMMAQLDKMDQHMDRMLQMQDMEILQQAMKEHESMMLKLQEDVMESSRMHHQALQAASAQIKSEASEKGAAKSEMAKSDSADHPHPKMMMENMEKHHSTMMSHFDQMQQNLDKMKKMQDMQKLQEALRDYEDMMLKLRNEMVESRQMKQEAVQMAAEGGSMKMDKDK